MAKHETLKTGAKREKAYPAEGSFPIRIDLVFNNAIGLRRLAETYGEGNAKYGPHNWKKGFPESVLLSHALEHIRKHMEGDKKEDHLAHATWNLFTLLWVQEKMPEIMDITGAFAQIIEVIKSTVTVKPRRGKWSRIKKLPGNAKHKRTPSR